MRAAVGRRQEGKQVEANRHAVLRRREDIGVQRREDAFVDGARVQHGPRPARPESRPDEVHAAPRHLGEVAVPGVGVGLEEELAMNVRGHVGRADDRHHVPIPPQPVPRRREGRAAGQERRVLDPEPRRGHARAPGHAGKAHLDVVEPRGQGWRRHHPQNAGPKALLSFEGRLPLEDDRTAVGADRHEGPPRGLLQAARPRTQGHHAHRGRVPGVDGGSEGSRLDLAGALQGPFHGLVDQGRGEHGVGGCQDPAPTRSVAAQPIDLEDRAGSRHTGGVDDVNQGAHHRVPGAGGALLLGQRGARRQPRVSAHVRFGAPPRADVQPDPGTTRVREGEARSVLATRSAGPISRSWAKVGWRVAATKRFVVSAGPGHLAHGLLERDAPQDDAARLLLLGGTLESPATHPRGKRFHTGGSGR